MEAPLRGGSWSDDDQYLRSASRDLYDPRICFDFFGFRCAAAEEAEPEEERRRSTLRGGSWFNAPQSLWSANRFKDDPTYRNAGIGFRCAAVAEAETIHAK
jgi:formylglycine-generating enzyme required for sulfatase activity